MEFEIEQELIDYIESCGCDFEALNPEFVNKACRECMAGTLKPAFDEDDFEEY